MVAPATSKKNSGTTDPFLRIVPSSGTSRVPTNSTMEASSIAGRAEAYVAVAETVVRDDHTRYLHAPGLPEIGHDYTDEEEQEWRAFFARPDVQAELEQLAEEAERQFAAGDTEEGGFVVE
jgi:non-ribosomal peptide synthetase component F